MTTKNCRCEVRAVPKRSAERAFALAAFLLRGLLAGAVVSSEWRRRAETAAISSIAALKAASFALEGLLKPLIFRTNCREALRTLPVGHGWIEVEEVFDVSAHAQIIGRVWLGCPPSLPKTCKVFDSGSLSLDFACEVCPGAFFSEMVCQVFRARAIKAYRGPWRRIDGGTTRSSNHGRA